MIDDLGEFKEVPDVVIENRMLLELGGIRRKVYTRDLFGND